MAYSRENIQKVKALLAKRRADNVALQMQHSREAAAKIPGFEALESELSMTGSKIMSAAMSHTLTDEKLAEIRERNEQLRAEKGALLQKYGYPADYADLKYTCEACSDTGYNGINMCSCMRRELVLAGFESSGLYALIKKQTFETFSLDFYKNNDKIRMEHNLAQLRRFAENFDGKSGESWLLTGATGLGKTHMSTAAAKCIIERGFDVLYDNAQEIFAVFEEERFSGGTGLQHEKGRTVEQILECDLLIMDDLGTEFTNQFTLSCLYNIINTRITKGKSTIINTNLTQSELRSRYTDRVASRLFGEYKPLLFTGMDIRAQKLQK
ncbi:MAG: hypothetical protein E7658_02530 [Ruminococcaceae bacterium]|nr:hypothetical protein [Oscillospiraceae bacterium]